MDLNLVTSTVHSASGSKTVMSAGAPMESVPPGNTEYPGGRDGHLFDHLRERQIAGLDQVRHDEAERGFEAEHSEWSKRELLLFFMGRMGRVVGRDGIQRAVFETFDNCQLIGVSAERRRHFGVGIVAVAGFVGQRDILRAGLGGNWCAERFGMTDNLRRFLWC